MITCTVQILYFKSNGFFPPGTAPSLYFNKFRCIHNLVFLCTGTVYIKLSLYLNIILLHVYTVVHY